MVWIDSSRVEIASADSYFGAAYSEEQGVVHDVVVTQHGHIALDLINEPHLGLLGEEEKAIG